MMPLGLKVIYTLFVCALVPIYWRQQCFRLLFICPRTFFSSEFFEAFGR